MTTDWMVGPTLALLLAAPPAPGPQGFIYQFEADGQIGKVLLSGENARMESEADEASPQSNRVLIWRDRGSRRLVLHTLDRTYYETVHSPPKPRSRTVATLGVDSPFVVRDVANVKVDVLESPGDPPTDASALAGCRPVTITFSYELKVGLEVGNDTMPAWVDGTAELCLVDALPVPWLPFEHDWRFVSGIPKVDFIVGEHLEGIRGIPIRRAVRASRKIENGESVTKTSSLVLRGFRPARVAQAQFQVPSGYRLHVTVVRPPSRIEPASPVGDETPRP